MVLISNLTCSIIIRAAERMGVQLDKLVVSPERTFEPNISSDGAPEGLAGEKREAPSRAPAGRIEGVLLHTLLISWNSITSPWIRSQKILQQNRRIEDGGTHCARLSGRYVWDDLALL